MKAMLVAMGQSGSKQVLAARDPTLQSEPVRWAKLVWRGMLVGLLAVIVTCGATVAQTEVEGDASVEVSAPSVGCGTAPIRIAAMQWTSSAILANIHARLLSSQFGCNTEVVSGDMSASLSAMAATGQPAIIPELWLTRVASTWNATLEGRRVRALAPSLTGGDFEGWFVPTSLLDTDPGLLDPETLREVARAAAANGDRMTFVSCPQDWACALINENLLRAYQLNDLVDLVEPTNRFEMDALISQAISSRDRFFFYYWQPNALLAQFDVSPIRLAGHNAEAFTCLASRVCPNPQPSGFAPESVSIVAADWVLALDPAIVTYLGKASMPFDVFNDLLMWQAENGQSVEATADRFVSEHQIVWSAWLD